MDEIPSIRVLLVDGAILSGLNFRSFVAEQPDIQIVAEADHSAEAIVMAMQKSPDVVLLDTDMPPLEAGRMIGALQRIVPPPLVLVAGGAKDHTPLRKAAEVGAHACVVRDGQVADLATAIRGLAHLRRSSVDILGGPASVRLPRTDLRPRELQILELIAIGRTNRQIARSLSLTPGTVRVYVSGILRRIGAGNRTEAAYRAMDLGIIRPALSWQKEPVVPTAAAPAI